MNKSTPSSAYQTVQVSAPARLHMGFIDLSGDLGRNFGSVGMALESLQTSVTVSRAQTLEISGQNELRFESQVDHFLKVLNVPRYFRIHMDSMIPAHAGLGSGTQLALAVGMALAKFWGLDLDVRDIARLSGRGARSGIGIAAFERGGFIVDGGRGPETVTPPLLSRLPVPDHWRWLLIFDRHCQGLSGTQESQAFQGLPAFSVEAAARLCHKLLISGLPALAEADAEVFSRVIADIQVANGEYFASAQGGRYTSRRVAEALQWLERQGLVGLGQSSWGPTGFCLIPEADRAEVVLSRIQREFCHDEGLAFQLVAARNTGAMIVCDEFETRRLIS